jgi:hypothetical protein
VNVYQGDWGEDLSLVEFFYNSTMHLVTKMSPCEFVLRKEAKKPMDLAIPMGQMEPSKESIGMVKGHEELYTQAKKNLE